MVKRWSIFVLILFVANASIAKDPPSQVFVWPPEGPALLKLTLGRFNILGANKEQKNFSSEVVAENLSSKPIKLASFKVFFFDKQKVRNGEGYISVADLPVRGKAKFEFNFGTRGMPDSLELVPVNVPEEFSRFMPAKEVPITVNSIPQGATLKVDGQDAGTTPKIVRFHPGKHILTFQLGGYAPGTFPFEVKPDEAPGGAISFELGSSMHDTVELRDGSVLTGDVETLSATEIEIRVGGTIQRFPRNSVKRILLIERQFMTTSSP